MVLVGVRFKDGGKVYDFDANSFTLNENDPVIVETVRGIEYGWVSGKPREVADEKITHTMKQVQRLATETDTKRMQEARSREGQVMQICQEKVDLHKLPMELVGCEIAFEGNKILIYFTAEGRVDFREMVRDLASALHARIELRQIGVRDETRMMGGLGPCGRECCCASFLTDFQPVSIKMAKDQGLSLNPVKISGLCGRLMCCLKYEQNVYEYLRKQMPKQGKDVQTPNGKGMVVDCVVLKQRVKVKLPLPDGGVEFKEFDVGDLSWRSDPHQPKEVSDDAATDSQIS